MNLIEALKTDLPLRLANKMLSYKNSLGTTSYINPGTFIDQSFLLENIRLTKEQLTTDNWEVQKTPCVHEPQLNPKWLEESVFSRLGLALEQIHKCKHCGEKIVACKWKEL